MPPSPPSGTVQVITIIPSNGDWYVHINDGSVDADHNDHLVICWGLSSSDKTSVVPYISDLTNSEVPVQVPTVSQNYNLYNPWSECPSCVRPPVTSRSEAVDGKSG